MPISGILAKEESLADELIIFSLSKLKYSCSIFLSEGLIAAIEPLSESSVCIDPPKLIKDKPGSSPTTLPLFNLVPSYLAFIKPESV